MVKRPSRKSYYQADKPFADEMALCNRSLSSGSSIFPAVSKTESPDDVAGSSETLLIRKNLVIFQRPAFQAGVENIEKKFWVTMDDGFEYFHWKAIRPRHIPIPHCRDNYKKLLLDENLFFERAFP